MNRISVILICITVLVYTLSSAQHGGLDVSFDNDGIVSTLIGAEGNYCSDIALQDDGKILLVGTSDIGTSTNQIEALSLVRYNDNGSLDATFSGDGIAIFDLGGAVIGRAVVVLPDGKILTAGTHGGSSTRDFLMAKFNSDGTVDMTFGTNGRVETDFGNTNDIAKNIHITPEGKIILTGTVESAAGDRDFAVAKYNTDGTPDNTFGSFGKVTFDVVNDADRCNHSALQADGKLILFGQIKVVGDVDFAILRCTEAGSLDDSFGTNGIVITDFGTLGDFGNSIVLQTDGKIVGTGTIDLFSDIPKLGLVRYNTDGSLDNSFGTAGKASMTVGGDEYAGSAKPVIQSDGKIIVPGGSFNDGQSELKVVRLSAAGVFDNSFGNNGIVTTHVGSNGAFPESAAIQSNSKILVCGNTYSADFEEEDFFLTRYLSGLELGVLDFSIADHSMLIYPNPIRESATIEYTLMKDEILNIDLYNISGRLVQSFVRSEKRIIGTHKEKLTLNPSIPSGTYILTLSNGAGSSSVRVVK